VAKTNASKVNKLLLNNTIVETKQVAIKKAFSYGWTSMTKNFWYFIGLAIIVTVINSAPGYKSDKVHFDILGLLLGAWMTCGYMKIALDYYSGTKREITDVFTQFQYYWRVLGATILLGVIIGLGFILLIIPGIYLAMRYMFTVPLIIDKNLDIGEAMKQSSTLTQGIKLPLFGFTLSALGVIILGGIALGVGIFVAIPIIWLAYIYLYKHMVASEVIAPDASASLVNNK
jgi:membrane-anchored glycerophosphoryl diester phosphodiesterase (GDPDase)